MGDRYLRSPAGWMLRHSRRQSRQLVRREEGGDLCTFAPIPEWLSRLLPDR